MLVTFRGGVIKYADEGIVSKKWEFLGTAFPITVREGDRPLKIVKSIAAVLLMLVAACALCACQPTDAQNETDATSLLPELKIGVDTLEPFFCTDENGDYAGIDAEIATEACKRAGYTPIFTEINWSNKAECVQNGTVDCLWTAFSKNGREDSYCWTDAYMQSDIRVIANKNTPDKDLDSILAHGKTAVRAGSKAEEALLQASDGHDGVQIYSCSSFEMAETAFVKQYAMALCCDEEVLAQVMDKYPGLYEFVDGSVMTVDLGVAFAKDNPSEAFQKVDDAIRAMKADGTMAAILSEYGVDASNDKEASGNA